MANLQKRCCPVKHWKNTTTSIDVHNKLTNYLGEAQISMKNVTPSVTGGSHVTMDNKCVFFFFNPEMLLVLCVTHRENLVKKKQHFQLL